MVRLLRNGPHKKMNMVAESIEQRERERPRMVVVPVLVARDRLKAQLTEDGVLVSA